MFSAAFRQDLIANSIAVLVLTLMIASVIFVAYSFIRGSVKSRLFNWPRLSIPTLIAIGLLVAIYLSYVEITKTEAVCGPIGNCNRVQESPFAILFGILPVGLLGVIGYLAILTSWLFIEYGPPSHRKIATIIQWTFAWFGIAFSIYLTYLEPFVIGATCAWCITSAIVMMFIFWASTKPAILVLQTADDTYSETEDDNVAY